jgi:glycosyltransferase involved in cell wall biosynthesis
MSHTSDNLRPIKVLYCILDSRFGGPHRLAQATGRQLRPSGVETFFLLGHRSGDVWRPDGFESFACKHIQCFTRHRPLRSFAAFCCFLPLNLRRICRFIRSHGIDIVHPDGILNFVPALAAGLTRTPVVWHDNDHLPGPLRWVLLRLVKALAATVIVQGHRLGDTRTGSDPGLRRKTAVLYTGIDLREFDPARYDAPARARLREELGVPGDGPLIGMIGNLNCMKGHEYFLRAARRIRDRVRTARFIVVGRRLDTNPGYWERLQQITAECGLQEAVTFAGFREDVAGVLAALDVFVLSSVLESCPTVVLEAMAMRVPVVATDVGAVSEMVLHGRTGSVVPPGDADAIADAVLACLAKPREQVRDMTAAARKRVEDVFEIGKIARQQLRLYEQSSRRRTAHPTLGNSDPPER